MRSPNGGRQRRVDLEHVPSGLPNHHQSAGPRESAAIVRAIPPEEFEHVGNPLLEGHDARARVLARGPLPVGAPVFRGEDGAEMVALSPVDQFPQGFGRKLGDVRQIVIRCHAALPSSGFCRYTPSISTRYIRSFKSNDGSVKNGSTEWTSIFPAFRFASERLLASSSITPETETVTSI